VQDEALKRADARIRELESASAAEAAPRDQSFLGGVRESAIGKREGRASVPSVRPGEAAPTSTPMSPAWHTATEPMAPTPAAPAAAPRAPGGASLGTAAAAAAGMIGGSLLLSSIRSMMGSQQGAAHAAFDPASGASGSSPWGGGAAAGGELSRQAGVDDVGRASSSGDDTGSRGHGLLDDGRSEDVQDDQDADDLDDDDFGFDDGGDDGSDP